MRLSDWKKEYHLFSEKASNTAWQFAFGGIAIVWLFRLEGKPFPKMPEQLIFPTGLFALALAFDLLHYIVGSLIWWLFYTIKERQLTDETQDPETMAPRWCKRPIEFFFLLKLGSVLVAYAFLIKFVWKLWYPNTG